MTSREVDEIVKLFNNVFIMKITIDKLINNENEGQKIDAILKLLISSNFMMLVKQCMML